MSKHYQILHMAIDSYGQLWTATACKCNKHIQTHLQNKADTQMHLQTKYKEIHIYKPPLTPVLYLMEEYVNHVKKDYKKPSKPIHFDRDSFMNSYDKTRKTAANSVKDNIMRNFVGITKE